MGVGTRPARGDVGGRGHPHRGRALHRRGERGRGREEAPRGSGLAEALHPLGHVLEPGVEVEDLLVDEEGLLGQAAVLVVEAQVEVDELHVLGEGELVEGGEGHVQHALLLEAEPEELLALELLGADVAGLLLARGEPQRHDQGERREEGEDGVEGLHPDAVLHEEEARPAQQDEGEEGNPDQQLGSREPGQQPHAQAADRQEEPPLQDPGPHGRLDEVEAEDVVEEGGVDEDAGRLDREGEVPVVQAVRGARHQDGLAVERLVRHVPAHDVEEGVQGEGLLAGGRPAEQHLARGRHGDVPRPHLDDAPSQAHVLHGRPRVHAGDLQPQGRVPAVPVLDEEGERPHPPVLALDGPHVADGGGGLGELGLGLDEAGSGRHGHRLEPGEGGRLAPRAGAGRRPGTGRPRA